MHRPQAKKGLAAWGNEGCHETSQQVPPGRSRPTTADKMSLLSPPVLAACAALLAQAALITWLVYEHRRSHQAELRSRSAMAELAYMNRRATAGELSASIAHEVNQPLTGIVLRAGAAARALAADKPDLDRVRTLLSEIANAGHRASDLIAAVRTMFKKDTGERVPVDLNELIMTVLALVRTDLQRDGIELRVQLDQQLPPVECEAVQLQQVVLNLVMNAIESMESTQTQVLTIKSERTGWDRVHISIEDTGTGIDPSNIDRVFKPLFTTKSRGMGIGLSICRSIMDHHDGRIWVSAGATQGATFHFELPIKADGN